MVEKDAYERLKVLFESVQAATSIEAALAAQRAPGGRLILAEKALSMVERELASFLQDYRPPLVCIHRHTPPCADDVACTSRYLRELKGRMDEIGMLRPHVE